ncbi:MAG: hypothetical protein K2X08_05420, partial [Chlamydiales bacterium]|nr:hypothetical protein [Chlamydiales bacterium]
NKKGVLVSLGGQFSQPLSSLLQQMGIDSFLAESAMSFALSRYTTEEEILRAAALIVDSVLSLQRLSEEL